MNAVPGTSSNETGIADAACFGCAHIARHTMETRGRETSWERAVDEASTASKATQALARNLRGARVLNNAPALRGLAPGGSASEIVEIVAWFAAAAVSGRGAGHRWEGRGRAQLASQECWISPRPERDRPARVAQEREHEHRLDLWNEQNGLNQRTPGRFSLLLGLRPAGCRFREA